jgi:hypothetical protein
MTSQELKPGMRVRITQIVGRREGDWDRPTEGTILSVRPEKTGSWHAHAKDAKLWLQRVRLQKADGEITTLNLDEHSRVEIVAESAPAD